MKKGITIISLAVVILLLSIITSTVIYTGSDTFKTTNKVKFTMEILDIQTRVDNYYLTNGEYPILTDIDFDISHLEEEEKKQLDGETIVNGAVKLAKIDLNEIGIKNTVYGNNKNSRDIYAVSKITGRVYYLKGFKYNKVRYLTLTDDLYEGINSDLSDGYKTIQKEDVLFCVSSLVAGKEPVKVYVKVPNTMTEITVTATNSIKVGEPVDENGFKIYEINTEDIVANYDIEVKYKYEGFPRTMTYSVTNSDTDGPIVTVTTTRETGYVLVTVSVLDEISGVSKIKFDKGNLDAEYFEKYGKIVSNNEIKCYDSGMYTIYAEDNLGNVTLQTLEITVE